MENFIFSAVSRNQGMKFRKCAYFISQPFYRYLLHTLNLTNVITKTLTVVPCS